MSFAFVLAPPCPETMNGALSNVCPGTNKTPPCPVVSVTVEPGICGFPCTVRAQKTDNRTVTVAIADSECKQINRLATHLAAISLRDLFLPMTRNPAYIAAEKSGCHPSCAVPTAILKAVEVALGVALPKEVRIKFKNETNEKDDRGTD